MEKDSKKWEKMGKRTLKNKPKELEQCQKAKVKCHKHRSKVKS